MIKKTTISDVGSVRIFGEGFYFNICNKVGDGDNVVIIDNYNLEKYGHLGKEFIGKLSVDGISDIYLSSEDIHGISIHKFEEGTYYIQVFEEGKDHGNPEIRFLKDEY